MLSNAPLQTVLKSTVKDATKYGLLIKNKKMLSAHTAQFSLSNVKSPITGLSSTLFPNNVLFVKKATN